MGEFIEYVESLLAKHEAVGLNGLESALDCVRAEIEAERDKVAGEIESVQSVLKEKGGISLVNQLYGIKQNAQKDLDAAQKLSSELMKEYETSSKKLEEHDLHKTNAELLYELLMDLSSLNTNDPDIELPPQHLVLLKKTLENLDLTEYSIAQKILTQQFNTKKLELLENFKKAYHKGSIEGMKETYSLLKDFEAQNECLNYYVQKTTESLEM